MRVTPERGKHTTHTNCITEKEKKPENEEGIPKPEISRADSSFSPLVCFSCRSVQEKRRAWEGRREKIHETVEKKKNSPSFPSVPSLEREGCVEGERGEREGKKLKGCQRA